MSLTCAFLILFLSIISSSSTATNINARNDGNSTCIVDREIGLQIPDLPAEGRQVVDAAFQSYSIEFSYMADYAGNFSYVSFSALFLVGYLWSQQGGLSVLSTTASQTISP